MITENYAAEQAIKKAYPNAIVIDVSKSSSPAKPGMIRKLQKLDTQNFSGINVKIKFAVTSEINAFTTRPAGSFRPVLLYIMAESKKMTAEQKPMKQYILSKKSRGYRGGEPPAFDFNGKPLLFDTLQQAIEAKKMMDARNPVKYDIFVYVPQMGEKYLKPIKIKESTEQKLRKIIREEINNFKLGR